MKLRTEPAAAVSSRPRVVAAGPSFARRRSTQMLVVKVVAYVLAICFGFVFMGPFLFAVTGSLMTSYELYKIPPVWIPKVPQFINYANVWNFVPWAVFTKNTLIITFFAMIGQICSACLVAYGFARFRFPGRDGSRGRADRARWLCPQLHDLASPS